MDAIQSTLAVATVGAVGVKEAHFWSMVGVWALNVIGTLLLAGLAFLFRRLGRLECDLAGISNHYVSRRDVREMIDEAGVYRDDKGAIAERLNQHSRQLQHVSQSVEKLGGEVKEIGGKIDAFLKTVNREG